MLGTRCLGELCLGEADYDDEDEPIAFPNDTRFIIVVDAQGVVVIADAQVTRVSADLQGTMIKTDGTLTSLTP